MLNWPVMIPVLAISLFLSWVQVRSETYIVKSSAGEAAAKRVLRELENFHQLVGTYIFQKVRLPELPIEVMLIGDEKTLSELAPVYNDKKLQVSGYYQRGQDRDFIVLSGRIYPRALTSTVYHELTHYFLSRAIVERPTWLNEGLAEYFATAEIREEDIYLGAVSRQRFSILRSTVPMPLSEFFATDLDSPYYNESGKANRFYTQAWAFVHFMMHSRHSVGFKQYLDALTRENVNLLDYLKVNQRTLEIEFIGYIREAIRRPTPVHIRAAGGEPTVRIEEMSEAEALTSISEIFLASGKIQEGRKRLEALVTTGELLPRASYYRGILARISQESEARDWFVDALADPQVGVRAAIQLVSMGELYIPSVRNVLEQAAANGTRISDVYWALAEIYLDDMRHIRETVRFAAEQSPPVSSPPAPIFSDHMSLSPYAGNAVDNLKYELMSQSATGPQVQRFVQPYYPADLLHEKQAGKVVLDVQVTDQGRVAGVWLISSVPEVFGSLATEAVRSWEFEAIPSLIRVVLQFVP